MKKAFLTADVAMKVKKTAATVRADARAGRIIPFAQTPGGVRIFDEAELERYAEERRQKQEGEAIAG